MKNGRWMFAVVLLSWIGLYFWGYSNGLNQPKGQLIFNGPGNAYTVTLRSTEVTVASFSIDERSVTFSNGTTVVLNQGSPVFSNSNGLDWQCTQSNPDSPFAEKICTGPSYTITTTWAKP